MSNPEPTQTLDSYPQLHTFTMGRHAYGPLIGGMQKTGYHKWGFVVYRTTYDDDEAFQRFVALMRQSVEETLEGRGQKDLLLQYHDFIIMDDKKFDGATKLQIRKHFVAWIAEQKDAGVIPELACTHTWLIPRFTHCLVVDKASMQNFTDYENWAPPYLLYNRPPPACALVDADWKSPGKGSAVCEPIENCRKRYVGWMYITLSYVVGMYSENNIPDFEDEGIQNYSRPPQIVPVGLDAYMPEVDN